MITLRSSHYSTMDIAFLNNVISEGLTENCPQQVEWYVTCEKCVHSRMCEDIKRLKFHLLDLMSTRLSEDSQTAK